MRLCANENQPGACIAALRAAGHDVLWVRESMPGASDELILACAKDEGRLLLTFDKDFGALVFHRGLPASVGVILFRIAQPSASYVATTVAHILGSRRDWHGHFSVVDDQTIRMRPLT